MGTLLIRALLQVSIYVRRGGPNFQEGLKTMKNCGDMLGKSPFLLTSPGFIKIITDYTSVIN